MSTSTTSVAAPSRRKRRFRIEATKGWGRMGWAEVWNYRDLLGYMVTREIKGKYRQMALGPTWIILQPFVTMIVLSVLFGRVAKLDSGGVPYPLLTFTAIVPWTFFSKACQAGVASLVTEMAVISKVYFPRMIVLLSAILSRLVDFLACCVILTLMMVYYRVTPPIEILALPFFVLLAVASALALSLWTSSITVRFRDVRFAVDYGIQLAMFVSPVAYSGKVIAESFPQWMWLYELNPMYWVIEGFRWCLLGTGEPPRLYMLVPCTLVAITLYFGSFIFRRTERTIVDFL